MAQRAENVFYREATSYTAGDVERLLGQAGFAISAWGQTLSRPLAEIRDVEPLQPGRGRGAFVKKETDRLLPTPPSARSVGVPNAALDALHGVHGRASAAWPSEQTIARLSTRLPERDCLAPLSGHYLVSLCRRTLVCRPQRQSPLSTA